MSSKTLSLIEFVRGSVDSAQVPLVSILAVGEPDDWCQQGNLLPKGGIAFLAFPEVTGTVLDHLRPSVIFSPVLAPSFDCIDLAMLLHNLDYRGAYRAFSKNLPKPDLIAREVTQICPRLDFQIVANQ